MYFIVQAVDITGAGRLTACPAFTPHTSYLLGDEGTDGAMLPEAGMPDCGVIPP